MGSVLGDEVSHETLSDAQRRLGTVIIGLGRDSDLPGGSQKQKIVATPSADEIGLRAHQWVGGPTRSGSVGGGVARWEKARSAGLRPRRVFRDSFFAGFSVTVIPMSWRTTRANVKRMQSVADLYPSANCL